LGGGLTIDSVVGQGTTISLWLPISREQAEEQTLSPKADPVGLGHGIALVVDDEELVRASTAHMLRELGYDVIEANCAEDALSLLGAPSEIDLLVTDHMMPGLTGTDLVERARHLKPGMRVLLISGYAETKGIASDLPRLTKPFKQNDLAASLAQL
jgi:CheY-like chemotaxis protein